MNTKSYRVKPERNQKTSKFFTVKDIEVARLWFNDEISLSTVSRYIKKSYSTSYTYRWLALCLRYAFQNKKIN